MDNESFEDVPEQYSPYFGSLCSPCPSGCLRFYLQEGVDGGLAVSLRVEGETGEGLFGAVSCV